MLLVQLMQLQEKTHLPYFTWRKPCLWIQFDKRKMSFVFNKRNGKRVIVRLYKNLSILQRAKRDSRIDKNLAS